MILTQVAYVHLYKVCVIFYNEDKLLFCSLYCIKNLLLNFKSTTQVHLEQVCVGDGYIISTFLKKSVLRKSHVYSSCSYV